MLSKALFVTLQASQGYGDAVADWLRGAVDPIGQEPGTRDWYALRFAPETFAIFDTFDTNRGRLTHLLGKVGRGLVVRTFTLLRGLPDIRMADVLAANAPPKSAALRTATHSLLSARPGQGDQLAAALNEGPRHDAGSAWYTMRTASDAFLVLEFPAEAGAVSSTTPLPAPLSTQVAGLCREIAAPWRAEVLAYKLD